MSIHIGIVDVTTVGSTLCQREISRLYPAGDHPEFSVHSLPFIDYKTAVLREDWDQVARCVLRSISILERCGAELIIIPSNTPHYAYDQISKQSRIPVLNLIALTAKACADRGFQTVAILGTRPTMTGSLYRNALNPLDIRSLTLDAELLSEIDQFIMHEIIPDRIQPTSIDRIRQRIETLPCDGVILGCTELPEVFPCLAIPFIDTTRLLAHAAASIANSGTGSCV